MSDPWSRAFQLQTAQNANKANSYTPGRILPPSDRLPGSPAVAYAPGDLAGDWVFVLASGGHRQRMRKEELVALYRDCDRALNDLRAATES